jgi:membrane-bound serine protease (ClpP class)
VKQALLRGFFITLGAVAAVFALAGPAFGATPRVLAVRFENDVNPVTADYVTSQIDRGVKDHYDAVVILLDTPGGLSEAMRTIYKKELSAPIPVIVYVSPDGARAASAGVWISEAADVLAMAPQTNIGSSTPIDVGGGNIQSDLRRKIVNDAAASLQALAKGHGRNVAWAADAVKVASNLPAYEALRKNVIDDVAPSLPVLLDRIDGQKTKGAKNLTLHTAGADITTVNMSLWERILDTLIDPNIITLLLSLGVLGIVVELWHPGLIFPATLGAISLLIAFYGLQVLPVSWAGLLLMLLAIGFWGAEPFVMSHGALALAGAVSFVFGALLLFKPAGSAYEVSLPVVLAIAGAMAAFLLLAVSKIVQVRRRPAVAGGGLHELVGTTGLVRRGGLVSIRGELWQARTLDGEALSPGDEVIVDDVERGLVLVVHPLQTHVPQHA